MCLVAGSSICCWGDDLSLGLWELIWEENDMQTRENGRRLLDSLIVLAWLGGALILRDVVAPRVLDTRPDPKVVAGKDTPSHDSRLSGRAHHALK